MRGVLYAVILSLLLLVPLERVNVADLLPVETIAVYPDGDAVTLETETGLKGKGSTVEEAVEDMKKASPQVVYLDTVEYLLVSGKALHTVDPLREYLKGSVRVWVCEAADNVSAVSDYVSVHEKPPKLRSWHP